MIGLVCLFLAFRSFDHIVKTEYECNRAVWEKDGKPCGFFWKAPECTWFGSGWERNRLSFVWLFTKPEWIQDGTDERKHLRRLRVCVLAWNILVLSAFFGFVPIGR